MIRRFLAAVLRPFAALVYRLADVKDPWDRIDARWPRIPVHLLGPGSRKDFGWYFEGPSAASVGSLAEIQKWLSGCKYASDMDLFREADFWQHPCTFERVRAGDCEDFALWAWRKLLEIGYDADFVVGRCSFVPVTGEVLARYRRHAWVVFRQDGGTYLYEPTWRDGRAVQSLDVVRHRYVPEFGVGPDRKPFAFCGSLLTGRERSLRPVGTREDTDAVVR